jgi:fimbrial chaperone protein
MTKTTDHAATSRIGAWRRPGAVATVLGGFLAGGAASAQTLTVLPVSVQMAPGQMSTSLSLINQGDTEASVQIRAFAWSQTAGKDDLTPSNDVLTSPPIATIPAGTTHVVRLVLRKPPVGHEAAYRILLDQIPPPAAPGTVRIALRLSIPIFAEPATRAIPHMQYHVERDAGQAFLVALNDGARHESIRNIALTTNDGAALKTENKTTPYVLAGATKRWPIDVSGNLPAAGGSLQLTALADSGAVAQPVNIVSGP